MAFDRNYNAGELRGVKISRDEQLAGRGNWVSSEGQLFLTRCHSCDTTGRGRENHHSAVADGICAWCGWGDNPERSCYRGDSHCEGLTNHEPCACQQPEWSE